MRFIYKIVFLLLAAASISFGLLTGCGNNCDCPQLETGYLYDINGDNSRNLLLENVDCASGYLEFLDLEIVNVPLRSKSPRSPIEVYNPRNGSTDYCNEGPPGYVQWVHNRQPVKINCSIILSASPKGNRKATVSDRGLLADENNVEFGVPVKDEDWICDQCGLWHGKLEKISILDNDQPDLTAFNETKIAELKQAQDERRKKQDLLNAKKRLEQDLREAKKRIEKGCDELKDKWEIAKAKFEREESRYLEHLESLQGKPSPGGLAGLGNPTELSVENKRKDMDDAAEKYQQCLSALDAAKELVAEQSQSEE